MAFNFFRLFSLSRHEGRSRKGVYFAKYFGRWPSKMVFFFVYVCARARVEDLDFNCGGDKEGVPASWRGRRVRPNWRKAGRLLLYASCS